MRLRRAKRSPHSPTRREPRHTNRRLERPGYALLIEPMGFDAGAKVTSTETMNVSGTSGRVRNRCAAK